MPLTEQQKLYLELLAEEAAEVIHIKSKIIRFGLEDVYGDKGTSKERLEEEIGHLLAAATMITELGLVRIPEMTKHSFSKLEEWKDKANITNHENSRRMVEGYICDCGKTKRLPLKETPYEEPPPYEGPPPNNLCSFCGSKLTSTVFAVDVDKDLNIDPSCLIRKEN